MRFPARILLTCAATSVLLIGGFRSVAFADDEAAENPEVEKHKAAAKASYAEGAYVDAIKEFEAAYALDPQPSLLFNLGRASEMAGKKEDAVVYFKRFLAAPTQVERLLEEAKLRLVVLERESANDARELAAKEEAAALQRALQARALVLENEAKTLRDAGKLEEAIERWKQAQAVLPDARFALAIGGAERSMGELGKAVSSYEQALAMAPNAPFAAAARAELGEMRQELAAPQNIYDPDAWRAGRSIWGLGLKAGATQTTAHSVSSPEVVEGDKAGTGLSFEVLPSLALNRWVSAESGLTLTTRRFEMELTSALAATLTTLEVPLRFKLHAFAPSGGYVANVYGGASYGLRIHARSDDGEYVQFKYFISPGGDTPQEDPLFSYGLAGGIELGRRALDGEFLVDLRVGLHNTPAFVVSSQEAPAETYTAYFDSSTFCFGMMMAYYYRGS